MIKKKGQSLIEYIIAIILFVVIVIYLLFAYFDRMPEEINKIKEQELCSEAESMINSFLYFPGDESSWESGGELNRLGFAISDLDYVSYKKWVAAVDRGYYNISKSINLNRTFHLSYDIYALNLTPDAVPPLPNTSLPNANLIRCSDNINVSVGSNSTLAVFNLILFFPNASHATLSSCPGVALETGETPTNTSKEGGVEVVINWTVSNYDADCINIQPIKDKIVYINRAILENPSTKKNFPIYAGNHTKIKDEFGSTEYLTLDEPYCEISRKYLIYNHSELFPARFNLKVW